MKRVYILIGALFLLATIEWVIKGFTLLFGAFYGAGALVWKLWVHLFKDLPGGDPYGAVATAVLIICAVVWFFRRER